MQAKKILLAEDSANDVELTLAGLEEYHLTNAVVVRDGAEALDYLYARGPFADRPPGDPMVVLLDLHMPKVDGIEVLRQVKSDPLLRHIPIVILTSSRAEQDLVESYHLGANAQAEATLQRTERMYQQILDAITDFVLVKDTQSHILWSNKAFCDYYGMTNEQLHGRLDAPFAPPDHTQQYIRDDVHVFATGKSLDFPEEPVTRHDGQVRLFHTVKSPIFDADGTSRMLVAVGRDITERKQAEAQRQSLEAQLLQAQKMESIGTLAAGVAHDFNNLLGVILGNLDLARDDLSPDETLLRMRLANIERAAERAATLTRHLLAFGHRQHLERRALDLHATIDNLLKLLRRIIGEDVEVCLHTAADVAPVFADAGQIEQVLMNLAANARDAMPQGGQLCIETRNVELDAAYCATCPWAKPGWYVQLTVSDTGHGMDAETCQRVFEPFFTTKEVGKGTGLGLSVVYGIIQQHDGLMHVSSEVERGTTFTIYLPMAPHSATVMASATAVPPPYGTEMLLVAEDEEALRIVVHTALTRLGYEVLLARDGQEAVQLYAAHCERIALLILDIVMPRLGGREAYAQIRAMGSDVPVLFVTDYSTELTRAGLVAETSPAVLQKPYSTRELGHRVREMLERTPHR